MCSPGVARCARISSASTPPAMKKTRLVRVLSIPIRVWYTVVSQLETRPSATTAESGGRSALAATTCSLREALVQVRDHRVDLRLRPVVADGRHLAGAVADDVGQPLAVAEQGVLGDVRAVATLRRQAVALGAHADEGLLAEPELVIGAPAHP